MEQLQDNSLTWIIQNDDSSEIDHNLQAVIRGGKDFESRLEVAVLEHFASEDAEVIELKPLHKIPNSFHAEVAIIQDGDEPDANNSVNLLLLRTFNY